ncbi:uncharacterized protein C8Q71DRAFT_863631 [Rhodofomes roseus]|uniref:Uncharacterized protein n=1 Tax=Rhodofomes roseus TaxID=34475 RepID=A0ABQ8JXM4_9APHY|nr:uncharacterized protein C8Q71DRAFT_863631 [Rhodofomes roseus]KAH9828953.1 hypothetical protein C8Q71DRAFT_863631 [Rhodofomes roseus]
MEAFHWQCHPAAHAFKDVVSKHDKVLQTHAIMTSPVCSIPASDIRWQFDLAGGALMDVTYVLSSTRFALDAGAPLCVKSAHTRPSPWDERVDEAMDTTLVYREGSAEGAEGEYNVEATVYADMRRANVAGFVPRVWELPTIEVETERALVTLYNFTMPHRVLYHYIATKDKATGETRYGTRSTTLKYSGKTGGVHGSAGASLRTVTNQSSIDQMKSINMVY